jgi:glycine cleavage system H lipoate-binding protein
MVALLVVLTLVTLIGIDIYRTRREERVAAEAVPAHAGPTFAAAGRFTVPGGVFLHKGHTWAHLALDGAARVGIDGFARGILGRIDRIGMPSVGARVAQGERLLSAFQGDRKVDFVSPLDGYVREVNGDAPPAEWLVSIEPTNLPQNLIRLRIASGAARWLDAEARRFAEFAALRVPRLCEVGATMPDGGVHVEGIFEELDDDSREAFEKGFLR